MQTQLITITTQQIGQYEIPAVDGRELHGFLEVQTPFHKWIVRRIEEYEFVINSDFGTNLSASDKHSPTNRPRTEFTLSTDMAKELCMVEKTERGKEARRYFIECERKLKQSGTDPRPKPLERLDLLVDSLARARKVVESFPAQVDPYRASVQMNQLVLEETGIDVIQMMGGMPEPQAADPAPASPPPTPHQPTLEGFPDPLTPNQRKTRISQANRIRRTDEAIVHLFGLWDRFHADAPVGVAQLYDLVISYNVDIDLGNKNERSQKIRFGHFIKALENRTISGSRIESAGTYQGARRWRILTTTPEH